jgi:uncharacterized protein (DUF1501 family)
MKNDNNFNMNRRAWLGRSGLGLASALGTGTLGNLMLAGKPAHAADYKALVCIFLYGGNDGLNMVVPNDAARYNQYKSVRKDMAIALATLSNMNGVNFGLHPAMAALAPVWAQGKLTSVFNVGPLVKPMTKAQFRAEPQSSALLPENLFSHSDQQILWESGSSVTSVRTGWGGRACAELGATNPVISVSGTARFGVSDKQTPLVLPSSPGDTFGAHNLQADDLRWEPNAARKAAITAMFAQPQDVILGDAFASAQREAFVVSERLGALTKVVPGGAGANAAIDTAFAPIIEDKRITTPLGRQLYQVAKLVAGNAIVQGNRQMYFAEMGGFDLHSNQLTTSNPAEGEHARRLKELADALACFHNAMKAVGLGDSVTAFTQSDFGRTLATNNSAGTDHAWGNHHLVLGGAVKGGATYGTYPTLVLGGPDDVGQESWEQQGRFIPTTSVDQYAATLLGWFGMSDAQLNKVLPNLSNFAVRKLGFLG